MVKRQQCVEKLSRLLERDANVKHAVEYSLQHAAQKGIESLADLYDFLDRILTHIPTEQELMPSVRRFYYLFSHSPGDMLRKDADFNEWMQEFVLARGNYLDTTDSAAAIQTFTQNPDYKIDDYIKGPSGWLSFNQFLARQLKPGKRPIEGRCDDNIIVAPSDGEFMGYWDIDNNATIEVKGITYPVSGLLADSQYRNEFRGGVFSHTFLSVADYHRYHVPVGGIVREVRKIPAKTWVNETMKPDGSLENIDDVGFQFSHTRGYIIIDSPVGLVVVMPVGMGHISSVNLTVEEGTRLEKGDEFGYFAFGGSDMILLFQEGKVTFTALGNTQYRQGQKIAIATGL